MVLLLQNLTNDHSYHINVREYRMGNQNKGQSRETGNIRYTTQRKTTKTQHNICRTSLCDNKQTNFVIFLHPLQLMEALGVIFHLWARFKVYLLVDALNSVIYYTIYFSSYLYNVSYVYPLYTRIVVYFENKIWNGG